MSRPSLAFPVAFITDLGLLLFHPPPPFFSLVTQELGDVEQWTKGVEQELQAVATSLEYVSSIVRKEQ